MSKPHYCLTEAFGDPPKRCKKEYSHGGSCDFGPEEHELRIADLERQLAEARGLEQRYEDLREKLDQAINDNVNALAELESLRADRDRYEFIKENSKSIDWAEPLPIAPEKYGTFDEVIDLAIAARTQQEESE